LGIINSRIRHSKRGYAWVSELNFEDKKEQTVLYYHFAPIPVFTGIWVSPNISIINQNWRFRHAIPTFAILWIALRNLKSLLSGALLRSSDFYWENFNFPLKFVGEFSKKEKLKGYTLVLYVVCFLNSSEDFFNIIKYFY
jgi:hypothetical protein